MLSKGQWLKIVSMDGEPGYAGRIGQVEHIDSIGQIHGTWGGCAIQPEHDSYELLTEEQAQAIIDDEKRKASEYAPPFIENARKVEVPFVAVRVPSRHERLNGMQPKQIQCKVVLDLNGNIERYKKLIDEYGTKLRGGKALVCGVADNACAGIYDLIRRKVGRDCCPICCVEPCDLRKNAEDYIPAIEQACELAMKEA